MTHIRMMLLATLAIASVATMAPVTPAHAARKGEAPAAHAGRALHRFSGTVTAVDKASLTVEKTGKEPRTMTFAKLAETRTQGEVAKDTHVIVWYREDGGRAVAHRVVVKGSEVAAER